MFADIENALLYNENWTVHINIREGFTISNKDYEKYQQYQTDKLHGWILTLDGLRVVCAGLDNEPEKNSKHMLEMLSKFRREGLVD